jgi:hypothetical protein
MDNFPSALERSAAQKPCASVSFHLILSQVVDS